MTRRRAMPVVLLLVLVLSTLAGGQTIEEVIA